MSADQTSNGPDDISNVLSWLFQFNPDEMTASPLQQFSENSLRVTLMQESWQDAGIDYADPGTVHQFYFSDPNLLVINLNQSR
jgi:hypothetical protein